MHCGRLKFNAIYDGYFYASSYSRSPLPPSMPEDGKPKNCVITLNAPTHTHTENRKPANGLSKMFELNGRQVVMMEMIFFRKYIFISESYIHGVLGALCAWEWDKLKN